MRSLRIGTRDSALALWQANAVQDALRSAAVDSVLVPVKSEGDLELNKPLYEMGVTGIFTKTLDAALLSGNIDLAVHSMKDVPTALPEGLVAAAVLKRANSLDILVHKGLDFLEADGIVATGSLRRRAQWLSRYPKHQTENLRGNVNTRLKKLAESDWNGAIFAAAGLERLNLVPESYIELPWMLPAPAQGAMVVVVRKADATTLSVVQALNDPESERCVTAERSFLRTLEGGCTAPIGALAQIQGDTMTFKGGLFALDGSQSCLVDTTAPAESDPWAFGKSCAEELLAGEGSNLMAQIRKSLS